MTRFALATLKTSDGLETALQVSDTYYMLSKIADLPAKLAEKSIRQLLESWDEYLPCLRGLAGQIAAEPSQFGEAKYELRNASELDTPVRFPNKLLAVGANYAGHLAEMGLEPVKMVPMPYFFRPPTTSLVGPGKTVRKPRSTKQMDWEIELVLVLGRELRHAASLDEASSAIAGYAIGLDLSCRDLQIVKDIGIDVGRGKAQDTLAPVGPFFLPKACLAKDVGQLSIKLFVNGEKMMDGNTSEMLYTPAEQLCEMSRYTTLEPGDLVFTGAPAGTAKAHGGRWLDVGDKVRAEIECIGEFEVEVMEDM